MNLRISISTRFLSTALVAALWISALCPVHAQDLKTLTLSDAISQALELNRELQALQFEERASANARSEARSALFPQLSWETSASKSESDRYKMQIDTSSLPDEFSGLFSADDFGFTGANYINRFQWQQLLFDYSVIGQMKLSDLQEEAAQWQTKGQEQTVVYNTVAAYLDILRAQELLQVQKQRLQLAEEQLDTAQVGFDNGLRIRTDVLRAELTRSSAMRDVVSAEISVERAQSTLNEIMGAPMQSRHAFAAGALGAYNPPQEYDARFQAYTELFSAAEENHPAVHIARLLVKQSEESINMARGEFLPRLSGQASWGFNEQGDPRFKEEEWTLAGAITIPIFEGGRRTAKLRGAKEIASANEKRYENTVRSIHNIIEQTALSLREERRNLDIALEAVEVGKENYDRFQNLYAEGLADSLDVTQALTELVESQTNVVTTRYNYLSYYIQLLQAQGTISIHAQQYNNDQWLTQ
ncbi:MAG: TolC family protein [Candidatus Hinthialibacter antarcticus]|nr:TolC family protein [Candidatus Hinthialibacter antarcticus]